VVDFVGVTVHVPHTVGPVSNVNFVKSGYRY
jgi:hypothetical protein